MSSAKRDKRTVTLSVTVGTREMEMLREIVEWCRFVSISEAVRVIIRHYYEAAAQRCAAR
jgi:Arc/MetJ-type ribon-helix-helix transcriptional regulator